ncbi:MAG: helix-turn-helix domain-containing protein [Acidimicrobiales bacterium]
MRGVRNFDPAALAHVRRRRGLSLAQLGERIGRARPNIITWEKGRSAPSPSKLVALAEALGVRPWQLTTVNRREAELSDLRAWAGLTQQQLADRAGLVRATYALVERAELPLREDVAQQLGRVLGHSVREVESAYARTVRRRETEASSCDSSI